MMSRIATIQTNLAETAELIRSYETAIADDPQQGDILKHDLRSLTKLQRQFREEFTNEANTLWHDECRYRLFGNDDEPALAPVASVLSDFQQLVSLVFHSMERKAPLVRSTLDVATVAHTSFRIGYAFHGSVGFVLTLPNERLMPGMHTVVDEAINTVFSLPRLPSPDAIKRVASQFGLPVVRACYRWAGHHVRYQLGSDIAWTRNKTPKSALFVQHQEFEYLQKLIDATSEKTTTNVKIKGVLTAANWTAKSFQFSVEGADEIKGKFEDAISETHRAEIPKVYTAALRKTSSINYSTDREDVEWFLVSLS